MHPQIAQLTPHRRDYSSVKMPEGTQRLAWLPVDVSLTRAGQKDHNEPSSRFSGHSDQEKD